jgi:hypothetical protein
MLLQVDSPMVSYSEDEIRAQYVYDHTRVVRQPGSGHVIATPVSTKYTIVTQKKVPRAGLMIVGLDGNNGSTVTLVLVPIDTISNGIQNLNTLITLNRLHKPQLSTLVPTMKENKFICP